MAHVAHLGTVWGTTTGAAASVLMGISLGCSPAEGATSGASIICTEPGSSQLLSKLCGHLPEITMLPWQRQLHVQAAQMLLRCWSKINGQLGSMQSYATVSRAISQFLSLNLTF